MLAQLLLRHDKPDYRYNEPRGEQTIKHNSTREQQSSTNILLRDYDLIHLQT